MTTAAIDLADPEYRLRPWPIYARLRDESPVYFANGGAWDGSDFYVLSRYEDVALALRNKTLFSSHIRRDDWLNLPMLVNRDAPEHTRLRHMANRAFNARLVRTLGGWIQEVVDQLITEILSQEKVEFVEAFTTALPLRVIGGLLGIPLDRKSDLRRWSQAVMDSFAVAAGMDPDLVPGFFEDLIEFGNYMSDLAEERRGKPTQEDILGELVLQFENGIMSRDELATMAWSFVAAGHETTMNLLGGGVNMMLTDHELAAKLSREPDRTEDFIEEYLRLFSPTQWLLRRAAQDVTLYGSTIPEGELIHVLIGSANRDPRQFPDPDTFDIDRDNKRDHMAFGAGPHFCPGAALSRVLADVAFRSIYRHIDRMSLDPDDPPQLRTRQGSYGVARMAVIIGAA